MEGILHNKLRSWFQKAYNQIKLDGLVQDIHVDEILIDEYKTMSKADVLSKSYQLFEYLVQYITKAGIDNSEFSIFLAIDLESDSNVFRGLPKSLSEIEESIDTYSIPKIILYYDQFPNNIPLIELYRVPVLLEPFTNNDNISVFYKEHRNIKGQTSNSNYTRDINIVYKTIN